MYRSIPACAGEPAAGADGGGPGGVYPRVCGGTPLTAQYAAIAGGLSPRVRGNPPRRRRCQQKRRSIPACAGEPAKPRASAPPCWVYPRVCGGTRFRFRPVWHLTGLSPRVRGNPTPRQPGIIIPRSIPACAGEPTVYPARGVQQTVYPRVCGGTPVDPDGSVAKTGLSPRVRGNPAQDGHQVVRLGSIPACAGEPRTSWCWVGIARVYPRVCGGTPSPGRNSPGAAGLSPRVRGNHSPTLAIASG